MQYPVPQFTDVEDKIIGSLTVKQFGIIFGAGVLVFLVYSVAKSVTVLIIAAVIIGLPALGVAFAKVNGRPLYHMFPYVYRFILSPKQLIFHKESRDFLGDEKVKNVEVVVAEAAPVIKESPKTRIHQVNTILRQREAEEQELLKQLH